MHRSALSRRAFLSLSGAAGASALFPAFAKACLPIPDPMHDAKDIANGINAFAHDLHARLARDAKGDLFFSPLSIEAALSMTAAGAKGDTLDEMRKVLHLPADPHSAFGTLLKHLNGPRGERFRGYELTVANAIWAQKDFPWHKEFVNLTRTNYGAGLSEVDFTEPEAARKLINEWVEKETREKIRELVPKGVLDPLTRMVLANAIYFKGTWLYQFDKKQTRDAAFTRLDGTKADVPLMSRKGTLNYGKAHFGGGPVEVLELPYAKNELSMLVYLPEKGREYDRLASELDPKDFAEPKLKPTEVRVSLPRFKAETEYSLKPALIDLGMKTAFGTASDFSGMSPQGKDLYISHVLHKAFVEVNEEGTEAAAATAVVVKERGEPQATEFRADRPFVFAIRDNATGAALFLGRYTGPAK